MSSIFSTLFFISDSTNFHFAFFKFTIRNAYHAAALNQMTTAPLPEQIELHRDHMWRRDEELRVETELLIPLLTSASPPAGRDQPKFFRVRQTITRLERYDVMTHYDVRLA